MRSLVKKFLVRYAFHSKQDLLAYLNDTGEDRLRAMDEGGLRFSSILASSEL